MPPHPLSSTHLRTSGVATAWDGGGCRLHPSSEQTQGGGLLAHTTEHSPPPAQMVEAMKSGKYPFVMCNLAPPDMVGHTGVYDASSVGM